MALSFMCPSASRDRFFTWHPEPPCPVKLGSMRAGRGNLASRYQKGGGEQAPLPALRYLAEIVRVVWQGSVSPQPRMTARPPEKKGGPAAKAQGSAPV